MTSSLCLPAADRVFGPQVHGCRADFDFTLLFQEILLSIAPSSIFLSLVPLRVWYLRKQAVKADGGRLQAAKLAAIATLCLLNLVLLVFWSTESLLRTKATVPAAALQLAGSILTLLLSYIEHERSVRPSSILNTYLLISLLFDVVQARTLWLLPGVQKIAGTFTAAMSLKALLLFLEAHDKDLRRPFSMSPPESTTGIFGQALFWWLNPLLWKGFRSVLDVHDLFVLDSELSSEFLHRSLWKRWVTRNDVHRYSLLFHTVSVLKWSWIRIILSRLCLIAFTYTQPFLISKVINQVGNSRTSNRNDGYGLIGATFLIYAGIALSRVVYMHAQNRMITKIRGALISVIYGKLLRLSLTRPDKSAAITLMSTDTDRICFVLERINELWAGIIEVAIATFLLEQQVGAACVAPAIVGLICTFMSSLLSARSPKFQRVWFEAIQRRVAATSEVLNNIKGIKSMGVLPKVAEVLQSMRSDELRLSANYRWFTVCFNVIGQFPMIFFPILTFTAYAISNIANFDISGAVSALSIISLMSTPLLDLISSIPQAAAAVSCFDRVQSFLLEDECGGSGTQLLLALEREDLKKSTADGPPSDKHQLRRLDLQRIPSLELRNIPHLMPGSVHLVRPSPVFPIESVVTVTGADFAVTHGQSPVLKDIDFNCWLGSLSSIIGPIGSGKTMLLQSLLGENVLLKGSMLLKQGDTAYCSQETWLSNTTIRENILFGYDYDLAWYDEVLRACLLDQDIIKLDLGDNTMVASGGVNLSGGQKQRVALARAIYSRKRLVLLDDVFSGLDSIVERLIFERVLGPDGLFRRHKITAVLATHSARFLRFVDQVIVLNEGRISEVGSYECLDGFAESDDMVETFQTIRKSQPQPSEKSEEEKKDTPPMGLPSNSSKVDLTTRRDGDFSTYYVYLRSIGWVQAALFLLYTGIRTTFAVFPQIWLKWWAESNTAKPGKDFGKYLGLYIFFGAVAVIFVGAAISQLFITIVPKSAGNLHQALLSAVATANYAFFISTDSGTILNRFSQDMSLIDVQLPIGLMTTTTMLLSCVGSAILIFFGAHYAAALIPLCIGVLYILQKFYLRTSRQMRFLELESKAPLFSLFSETIEGLATIRAFGRQRSFHRWNLELLDTSLRPFYFLFCIQRWLNLVLDLVIAGLAVFLVTLAVELPSTTSAGAIGIALVNVLNFNQLLAELITAWTSLETSIGAVSRVSSFVKETTPETQPNELPSVPEDWPANGAVDIQRISASYTPDSASILSDISISIRPGEKVGICGRSGSGKSSLFLVLLRLLDQSTGSIRIDGIPLEEVNREMIRSRLNVLPQDPVILPGSLRFNMDPWATSSDESIGAALRRVGLWDVVNDRGGLDAETGALGLSHGQLQLLVFARATLHPGRILIMDEPTSSLNPASEAIVSSLIREEFAQKTVIAIAHRLETIRDFDRVLVLDSGRIVEVGNPDDLLQVEDGHFKRLWGTAR